ncbi:transcriptional regulator, ArgR family [Desulfonispora thiosulfatigenes DSM 11270]|uniref:Arginine repressor n=2 Tax=Desulfonispora thiosulfatigenes TaxID=83661 RepID=A0A1W1VNS0_DESTI|nr:transcriptional regulator, ArgR family [Desulfonispora thiosulfatigenes DSM 11270]
MSSMKSRRQKKVLDIIKDKIISTQEELAESLREEGLNVTQATVSRDIKELGLIKVAIGNDMYKYAFPIEQISVSEKRLKFMFQEFVSSIDFSENMIVIRTPPGNAQTVASLIDGTNMEEIIGTIAGDDTILLIIKPKESVAEIIDYFNNLLVN